MRPIKEMNILFCSPSKLSRNLNLNFCSRAKKDSISYFWEKRFYLIFLNTHKLKIFFDSKFFSGFFLGVDEDLHILIKKNDILKINGDLHCYVFIYDENKKKKISEIAEMKIKKLIEKSIIYLEDRKKKLIKYL